MSERASGYYWVKFDWVRFGKPEKERWEPAAWAAEVRGWVILGHPDVLPERHEALVFLEVDETEVIVRKDGKLR
jgi:hypothetical protein